MLVSISRAAKITSIRNARSPAQPVRQIGQCFTCSAAMGGGGRKAYFVVSVCMPHQDRPIAWTNVCPPQKWSAGCMRELIIILARASTCGLGPQCMHMGAEQPQQPGQQSHHAKSPQPSRMMLGQHALHQAKAYPSLTQAPAHAEFGAWYPRFNNWNMHKAVGPLQG